MINGASVFCSLVGLVGREPKCIKAAIIWTKAPTGLDKAVPELYEKL